MAQNINQLFGIEPTDEETQEAAMQSYANGYMAGTIAVNKLNELFAAQYGPNVDPDLMRGIYDAIRAEI